MKKQTVARRHATRFDRIRGITYYATPTQLPAVELLGDKCGTRANLCTCTPVQTMAGQTWNDNYGYTIDPLTGERSHAVTYV